MKKIRIGKIIPVGWFLGSVEKLRFLLSGRFGLVKKIILACVTALMLLIVLISLVRAVVLKFYPDTCVGDWDYSYNAIGKPDLDDNSSPDSFDKTNSAYFHGGYREIFCGNFRGDLPPEGKIFNSAKLKLSWVLKSPQATPTPIIEESEFEQKILDYTEKDQIIVVPDNSDVSSSSETRSESPNISPDSNPTETPMSESGTPEAPTGSVLPETTNPTSSPKPTSSQDVNSTVIPPTKENIEQTNELEGSPIINSFIKGNLFNLFGGSLIAPWALIIEIGQEITPDASSSLVENITPLPTEEPTEKLVALPSGEPNINSGTAEKKAETEEVIPPKSLDDFLEISFSVDGKNWHTISSINSENFYSTEFSIPIISWNELSNLQIRIGGTGLTDNQSSVYLDGMSLEVSYGEENVVEYPNQEDIKNLPRVNVKDTEIFKSDKKSFRVDENLKFEIDVKEDNNLASPSTSFNKGSQKLSLVGRIWDLLGLRKVKASGRIVGMKVKNHLGEPVAINPVISQEETGIEIYFPVPDRSFKPGVYKLEVEVLSGGVVYVTEREFAWGVLAINTNKSLFLLGDKAFLQMASLNSLGKTLCNSNLELTIVPPRGRKIVLSTKDGGITLSDTCGPNNYTDKPDYFSYYDLNMAGDYGLRLVNLDTGFEITDSFSVADSAKVDLERIGATRVNPFLNQNYFMTLVVKAQDDFDGQIIETVPKGFNVIESSDYDIRVLPTGDFEVIWDRVYQRGQVESLIYEYDPPDISPQIFLLGPAKFISAADPLTPFFQEERHWQLASDYACQSAATGNWSAKATWTSCGGGVPGSLDTASIMPLHTVTVDSNVTVNGLTIGTVGGTSSATLTQNCTGCGVTRNLTVTGSVVIAQPRSGSGATFTWAIDDSIATVSGTITIGGTGSGTDQIARIQITSGTLNANGGMSFSCSGRAANCDVKMSGGAGYLKLKGSITNSNYASLTAGTTSTFVYADTSANQTVNMTWGGGGYNNLEIDKGAYTATSAENITSSNLTGNITVTSGIFRASSITTVGNSGKAFTVDVGATFKMTGNSTFPSEFTTYTFRSTSLVWYAQLGSTKVASQSYGNLEFYPFAAATGGDEFKFDDGTTTIANNLLINSDLAMTVDASLSGVVIDVNGYVALDGSTSTFQAPGSSGTFNIYGSFYQNDGTFTHDSGTITFDGVDSGRGIKASGSFYNLTINGSGGEWSPSASKPITITNDLTMTAGTLNNASGSANIEVDGTVAYSGSGGTINLTTGRFDHKVSAPENFTSTPSGWTFKALYFYTSGATARTITSGGKITVTASLSVGDLAAGAAGVTTLDAGSSTVILSGSNEADGDIPFQIKSGYGTLTASTSTFRYTGSAATTVEQATYYALEIKPGGAVTHTLKAGTTAVGAGGLTIGDGSNAGIVTANTNNTVLDVNGGFTIATSATFIAHASNAFTVEYAWNNGGTFTHSNGTVTFDGSTLASFTLTPGNSSFYNLTISQSGTRTLTAGSSLTVANDLKINDGALSDSDVGVGGTVTVNGNVTCSVTCGSLYLTKSSLLQTVNASKTFGTTTGTTGWLVHALHFSASGVSGALTANSGGTGTITVTASMSIGYYGGAFGTTLDASNRTFILSGSDSNGDTPFAIEDASTLTENNSTFRYTGTGATTVRADTYYNLEIEPGGTGTHTIAGNLVISNDFTVGDSTHTGAVNANTNDPNIDINGNFTIAANSSFVASNSGSLTVAKNFSNASSTTFTNSSGTITFDTANNSTVSGTGTVFYGFAVATNDKKMRFTAGQTFETDGLLTITGGSGHQVLIVSTASSSQWFINHQGTENATYAYIQDSGCDGSSTDISVSDGTSTDGGNNGACWIFNAGVTISGTVYTNEAKSSHVGSGVYVGLSVNGGATTYDQTDSDGVFSFSSVVVATNNPVVLFLKSTESDQATFVTQAINSTTDITGIEMYTSKVVLSHKTAGPMTNSLLTTGDNGDAGIHYVMSGGNADFDDNFEVWVETGKTYTPGGTVEADDLEVAGTGVFNPAGNAVAIHGGWTVSATGSFTSSGIVTFSSSTTETIITGGTDVSHDFSGLTFNNASGIWNLSTNDLAVTSTLTITAGIFDISGKNLTATGATFSNDGTLRLQGAETVTGLNMDTNSGTIEYDGTQHDPGYTSLKLGNDYYNLKFSGALGDWTAKDSDVNVDGDFTMTAGTFRTTGVDCDAIYVAGDWNTVAGTFVGTNKDVIFDGSGTNTLSGGTNWLNDVTISAGDTRELGASLELSGTTLVFGSLTTAGNYDVVVIGDFTCNASCGTVNLTNGSVYVRINTTAGPATKNFGPNQGSNIWTFKALHLGVSGANDATIRFPDGGTGAFDVTASMSVGTYSTSTGKTTFYANNRTFNLSGSDTGDDNPFIVDSGDIFTASVSTIQYTGSSYTLIIPETYYNLEIKPGGTVAHTMDEGAFVINNNLTIGDGTHTGSVTANAYDPDIDVNGSFSIAANSTFVPSNEGDLTIAKNFTNNGTYFSGGSNTITFDTTSDSIISGDDTVFYNFTSITANKHLKFKAGDTFEIDGIFTIAGSDSSNKVNITSDTADSQWFINHQGTESVSYAYIKDSGCDASSTNVYAGETSFDAGNNDACWVFAWALTLTVDSGSDIDFGNLTPGARITKTSRLKVDTTSETGYTVSVGRDRSSPATTIASAADTSINISDSAGGIDIFDGLSGCSNAPNVTAPWVAGASTGLGFTLWKANIGKNTTCWGTGTSEADANNKYAYLEASDSVDNFLNATSNSPNPSYASVGWSIDVPGNQRSTSYGGYVVYTATATP